MKVGYSRISDQQQALSDPLGQAEHELRKAGAELVLVEVGSGTDDTARPKFRQLRDLILDGKVSEVITPSQDRLGRNLQLVMEFVQTCQLCGVKLRDLNGRELEVRTADGRLMTQLIGALDEHRSRLYGEKTRRHLQAAREQGFPARSRLPFGLMKVRNDAGRFVAIDLDPITAPLARQRIDWFLHDGLSLTKLCQRIQEQHPDHVMQPRQLRAWLVSPMLTGRLCWHQDGAGRFRIVNPEPSFPGLISDGEHEAIKRRAEAFTTNRALRGRPVRMLTGIAKCADCGFGLNYKITGRATTYLRCNNIMCRRKGKSIRGDDLFGVLQYSLGEHARALVPILQRPAVDPPEVAVLQREIEVLQAVTGTAELVEAKRAEINRLRSADTTTPAWLLVAALRSPMFWLKPDDWLNRTLRLLIDRVVVQLGDKVADAQVLEVRCRTSPALAPLPPDQRRILMPRGLADLLVHLDGERLAAAVEVLGD